MGKRRTSLGSFGTFLEKGLCYLALFLLALVPVAEVFARQFKTGIPGASGIMTHLLLVVGLLAAMITTRQEEHLSIAVVQYISGEKLKKILGAVTGLVSVFVSTILTWSSVSFIKICLSGQLIGFIPDRIFALVMPIGFGVMTIRFARLTPLRGAARLLPVMVILLGTACSLPAIAKLLWGFDPPDRIFDTILFLSDAAAFIKIPAIILFFLSALAGSPIFAAIGGIALLIIQASGGESEAVTIEIYTALTESDIIAIPLFTLTGFFLSESKAGERLVHAFRSLFSWIPGGMIIATVVICAFFTSFTGASGVTILALGGILYTILTEKAKYPERFTVGLLTSVGGIGLLFPPSLPIILVGATTYTNIIHVFLGALIPGIILVLAMIVFGIIASVKTKIPVEPFDMRRAASALRESAFEILLPILLIGGYFTGILSLVEIGAVAVVYVFILEVLIHRDIAFRDLPRVFYKAVPIIGGVLAILAMAKALSYAIVDTQVPENLARWLRGAVESKYLFLLLLNLALLVVGCLMDIFSAILVVLPLISPLGQAYGIDPVHLGIIFIINLEVGFLTPPVGLNLFLASYRFKKPFMEICRYVWPFLLIQLAVVLLVTYVPWFSTFLPRFF
ncbi:MAG: TRAP transporter large permease subunit [Spirochaetaceae bacterium]|jgi:tripartite ATP-independent transporter DctM subunit|nr:TRAP transporter large permease subunit [Spirochaetaceae bacterium]